MRYDMCLLCMPLSSASHSLFSASPSLDVLSTTVLCGSACLDTNCNRTLDTRELERERGEEQKQNPEYTLVLIAANHQVLEVSTMSVYLPRESGRCTSSVNCHPDFSITPQDLMHVAPFPDYQTPILLVPQHRRAH